MHVANLSGKTASSLITRFMQIALAGWMVLCGLTSHAELADRDQPINLEADSVMVDDANRTSTYQGNVQLSQGGLLIEADKLVVEQDEEGMITAKAEGNLAHFRQKNEARNEYVEGFAERIEYSAKDEKMKLLARARVKRNRDEVRGSYIAYNMKTQFFEVEGKSTDAGKPRGRVRAVIEPKNKTVSDTSSVNTPSLKNK